MIYHVEWPVGGPRLRPHYSVSSRALLLFPILIVLHHLQTLRPIKESVERVSLVFFNQLPTFAGETCSTFMLAVFQLL